jgi:hypothetical protein
MKFTPGFVFPLSHRQLALAKAIGKPRSSFIMPPAG